MAKQTYYDQEKVDYAFGSLISDRDAYDDFKWVFKGANRAKDKGVYSDGRVERAFERVVDKNKFKIAKQQSDYEEEYVRPLNAEEKRRVAARLNDYYKGDNY